jgi:glycosyltransferase involved in cell wall biosynthesis
MPSSSKPRVAVVAASLDILGGQAVQATALVNGLRSDGYDATLLPIDPRFPPGFRWLRRLPYVRTLANQALYVPSLAQLAAVDIAHVFSASYASFLLAPVPAMVTARMLRKRVVLHYHSGEAEDHLANWGPLVHPWLRLADEIVVPSAYLGEVFARAGYRATVIPNVVDLSRFTYRERRPLEPRLVSTRNLEPMYGVDVVVDAFARLKEQVPGATLTIAGTGSEERRLRRAAAPIGGIRFVGQVGPEHMPYVLAAADIFLNASVVDNQPVSILEAFAAGLPVVSTPTGDIAAMVQHGHAGILVPPGDPAALAGAVATLLRHPDDGREMARRALKGVGDHTWASVRGAWASVYAGDEALDPDLPPYRAERLSWNRSQR